MTREEAAQVLAVVQTLWPHSRLGADPAETLTAWQTMLDPFTAQEAMDALRRLAATGREHAPVVGVVAQSVALYRQGSAPPLNEVQASIGRHLSLLPYDPERRYSPAQTAEAIEALASAGVHEAALRFVQEMGLRAVLAMPDGSRYPLDPNQQADRRDMERHYRAVTVPAWQRDPVPGRALERAREAAGLERGRQLQLGGAALRVLDAGEDEGEPIGADDVLAAWKASKADRDAEREASEAAALAEAREANAERQRALAELAERQGKS